MVTWLTGMGQWWERANTTVDIVGAESYRCPVCRSRDCREISKVAGGSGQSGEHSEHLRIWQKIRSTFTFAKSTQPSRYIYI